MKLPGHVRIQGATWRIEGDHNALEADGDYGMS